MIPMKNGLGRGVRQASDFLMALQLTGAAKTESLANLQIRLPIVVIGGGLTAVDTATESLAYYVVQVEKFLKRYELLAAEMALKNLARAGYGTLKYEPPGAKGGRPAYRFRLHEHPEPAPPPVPMETPEIPEFSEGLQNS